MHLLAPYVLAALLSFGATEAPLGDFRMTVQDAFNITGMGVVVTGVVEGGPVSVGDVICLRPAEGDRQELTVAALEQFRRVIEVAEPGSAVGVLFEGVERDDFTRGDELTSSC